MIFFPQKYVFYVSTYYSTQSNNIIMIDNPFDSTSSLKEIEGLMNIIG